LHILATRLLVCAFAAAGCWPFFRLTQRLLGAPAAVAVTLLTAVYPIWFAQSSLAHADIFAAAFTLWAFALYLPRSTTVSCTSSGSETSGSPSPLPSPASCSPAAIHITTGLSSVA
jgi:hypothetical protein